MNGGIRSTVLYVVMYVVLCVVLCVVLSVVLSVHAKLQISIFPFFFFPFILNRVEGT